MALLSWPAAPAVGQQSRSAAPRPPTLGERFVPADVDWSNPIYETSFDAPSVLADWSLEGGHSMSVDGGNLVLTSHSTDRQNHLVAWLRQEIPADFLLEFSLRPRDRLDGLNIVFFNTRGINGENIFDPSLEPRDGTFKQYHSGDLNGYHISYWAGERDATHLRKNRGFDLVTKGEDLIRTAPADSFQTVRVYKRDGHIRLIVDDVVALAYDDDGTTYGAAHSHPGWIGLRQMGHTGYALYGDLRVYPLKP